MTNTFMIECVKRILELDNTHIISDFNISVNSDNQISVTLKLNKQKI